MLRYLSYRLKKFGYAPKTFMFGKIRTAGCPHHIPLGLLWLASNSKVPRRWQNMMIGALWYFCKKKHVSIIAIYSSTLWHWPRRSNNWGAYWAKPFRNKASSSYPHSLEAQFLRLEELQLALCWQLQDHVPRGKLFWRHGVLRQEQDILSGGDCYLSLQRVLLGLSRRRESDWRSSLDLGLDSSLAGKV